MLLREVAKIHKDAIEVLELKDIQALILKLSLLIVGFFAPIQKMMLSLLFLILVDLVTGVLASIKRKQKITSSKLSRTVSKMLVYLTTIAVVHVANNLLLFGNELIPLEQFVIGFIAITELKSIFENLNRITRQEFLRLLIHKLSNEGRKKKIDRK